MKLKLSKIHLLKALKERNLMFTFALGLLLANIFLAFKICSHHERVVVVPAHHGKSFWVNSDKVSATYIEEMSLFFINNLLDITPSSFAFQRDVILKHVASEYYNNLRKHFLDEEKRYKKENLSTSFHPMSIKIIPDKLSANVTGVMQSYVAGKKLKQMQQVYKLIFRYKDARLLIESFELISEKEKS